MHNMFPKIRRCVSVAVDFDEHLEPLINTAASLCAATGATLRLVHVCDPWTKSFLASSVEAGPPELVRTLQQETAKQSEARLAALAATLPKSLGIETQVLKGEVAQEVASDAEANGVGLIVIGSHKGAVSATAMGYSTAVSLIMDATVPVLVINESGARDFNKPHVRIMVADDLSENSLIALSLGFSLASNLKNAHLLHTHVETYADLRQPLMQKLNEPLKKLRRPLTAEYIKEVHSEAEAKLQSRAQEAAAALEDAGGRYRLELASGVVADELEKSATAARIDVVVFGQHRVFHRKPLHVGQIPFKAMLGQSRAVIVVPQML